MAGSPGWYYHRTFAAMWVLHYFGGFPLEERRGRELRTCWVGAGTQGPDATPAIDQGGFEARCPD